MALDVKVPFNSGVCSLKAVVDEMWKLEDIVEVKQIRVIDTNCKCKCRKKCGR